MICTKTTVAGRPCRNLSRRGDCGQHVPGVAPRLANASGTPVFTDVDPLAPAADTKPTTAFVDWAYCPDCLAPKLKAFHGNHVQCDACEWSGPVEDAVGEDDLPAPPRDETSTSNPHWMSDEDAPVRMAAYPGDADMEHWAEEQAVRGTGPILIGQVGSGAPLRPARIDPVDAAEMTADGRVGFAIAGGRIARVEPDEPAVVINGPWMRVKESDLTAWVAGLGSDQEGANA